MMLQRTSDIADLPAAPSSSGSARLKLLRREIQEEAHAGILEPRLLGVLETTFQLEGVPKHELVFVFEASFSDAHFYQLADVPLYETGWEGALKWIALSDFRTGVVPLYPEGLLPLLDGAG
jgi:hypothetical protein